MNDKWVPFLAALMVIIINQAINWMKKVEPPSNGYPGLKANVEKLDARFEAEKLIQQNLRHGIRNELQIMTAARFEADNELAERIATLEGKLGIK